MSKKVSPIPRGYRTATTCLTVIDIDSAVAFYQAAFAAELLTRLMDPSESYAIHATIKIGNSIIALNPESAELGMYAPVTLGVSAGQVHLYVDHVDAAWERAIEAGAIVSTPVFDAYWGDRTGVLRDGNGHLWSIASKIENVSQDEIAKRARVAVEPVEYEAPAELLYVEEVVAAETVAA
ncbi:MAG: VOC family protein [Pseudomonadota bacterium]